MKSTSVDMITSNDGYVRMRIFDGNLGLDEAGAELLRLEQCQHAATRKSLIECQTRNAKLNRVVRKLSERLK